MKMIESTELENSILGVVIVQLILLAILRIVFVSIVISGIICLVIPYVVLEIAPPFYKGPLINWFLSCSVSSMKWIFINSFVAIPTIHLKNCISWAIIACIRKEDRLLEIGKAIISSLVFLLLLVVSYICFISLLLLNFYLEYLKEMARYKPAPKGTQRGKKNKKKTKPEYNW